MTRMIIDQTFFSKLHFGMFFDKNKSFLYVLHFNYIWRREDEEDYCGERGVP